ncbi:hypothetical protein L596_024811 [Steinernema carpocapsae]|uniref:Uncharacterized protein n=1 Tax=Steinernema carpocapsae TaxID=34508 RepID=A0A4U5M5U8_STECR|nr:hypothetical protein L596_024811 [Steinernema carpocapsae]
MGSFATLRKRSSTRGLTLPSAKIVNLATPPLDCQGTSFPRILPDELNAVFQTGHQLDFCLSRKLSLLKLRQKQVLA